MKWEELLKMGVKQAKKAGGVEIDPPDPEGEESRVFQEGMAHFRELVAKAQGMTDVNLFPRSVPDTNRAYLAAAKQGAKRILATGRLKGDEQAAVQAVLDAPSPFRSMKVYQGVKLRDDDLVLTIVKGGQRARCFSFPKDMFDNLS